MLFNESSICDVLKQQESRLRDKIKSLESNYLLNSSESDLINWLVAEFTLNVPILDESKIEVEHAEKQIDVSRDPRRIFFERSGPFYVQGTEVTFVVPFSGDGAFFGVQPQNFTWSTAGSIASVKKSEVRVALSGENLDGASAKRQFESELQFLRQNLQNLKTSVDQHNKNLEPQVRQQITQRKEKLLRDANMVSALGYPIKRRDGVPVTYAVPVQQRKPQIERPAATSSSFQPEPVLPSSEYENILSIIRNMVRVMEQSPKAFETMGEEDLRTHFLVQLNAQYEGRATGETFNFQGKTDILIREGGKNVFIAECKFWAGEKQFLETIDQLLSYLSWRDTKTAVLIFSRNAKFSEVVSKIFESTPKHKCYKRTTGQLDESSSRYVFHQPSDTNRELIVTVMAFDIPTPRKTTASEKA